MGRDRHQAVKQEQASGPFVMLGAFAQNQPVYAAYNIATFPIQIEPDGRKRPAVQNYDRVGLQGSADLARKFSSADAFGYMAGNRSRVTVLDIDTGDERVLTDALAKHGQSPVVIRTGSGNFQVPYRYNGERRQIRPFNGPPIDGLGGGVVVAPPSFAAGRSYEIIAGRLADLDNLPKLQGLPAGFYAANDTAPLSAAQSHVPTCASDTVVPWSSMRAGSGRNNQLWRQLMREAHCVDIFDALLDRARTLNEQFAEPLSDDEVNKITQSAWHKTESGQNRFGRRGVFFDAARAISLATTDPDRLVMESLLRAHNGPQAEFMATNDWLVSRLRMTRKTAAATRARMITDGTLVEVSRARTGMAARYRWGTPSRVVNSDHLSSTNTSPPPDLHRGQGGKPRRHR